MNCVFVATFPGCIMLLLIQTERFIQMRRHTEKPLTEETTDFY